MSAVGRLFSEPSDVQVLGSAALALLLEQLPGAAVCLIDAAGVIQSWHASAEKLLGHVAGQVEGHRLESLFPEERRFEAALARALFDASAQGRSRSNAGLMTRNGQRRVCTLDIQPCVNAAQDVEGFIVLMRASGPVRSLEAAGPGDELVVAHRSNLARAHEEPAWIGLDLSMRVTRVSRRAADWMACDVEDPLGRPLSDCVMPSGHAEWPVILHRVVRNRRAINVDVSSVEEGGGQARTARLVGLNTADGRLDGFTLVLEEAPGVSAATIDEVALPPPTHGNDGLLGAAHDLREPLRKMQHYAQQLQTREATRLSDDGRRQLESMQAAAERMQSMVGGMLRLARVDASSGQGVSLDLQTAVDEARADLAVLIEEHEAEFDIGALGTVVGDSDQLRALFQNLIDNSIRYRHVERSPRIRIAVVPAVDERDRVHLEYVDNGAGIDEPERVFSPFGHRRDDRSGGGTGIGLSLCQRICRRHHGDLRIVETGPDGTRFRITLNDLDRSPTP
ncbi:ATP-binding protein [Salinisphaera sp. T31B1]|uniref:ATP-binding protein n=1 Tax=Salinisphaera sp. T31B1 TaxID=727963 RepID=UPI00333FA756